MRVPVALCIAAAILAAACAPQPEQKTQPTVVAAESPTCETLALAMEAAEADRNAARNVRSAASAASIATSILSFVPGVGIAALAAKGAIKAAKLAGKDAERAPAEAHAESLAQWEEMGCEGEA